MGVRKWNKTNLAAVAKKYKRRIDFQKLDHCAYTAAARLGFLQEISEHMPARNYWTEEKIRTLVDGLTYKAEFRILYRSAYQNARLFGILHELTEKLKRTQKDELIKIKNESEKRKLQR